MRDFHIILTEIYIVKKLFCVSVMHKRINALQHGSTMTGKFHLYCEHRHVCCEMFMPIDNIEFSLGQHLMVHGHLKQLLPIN